MNLITPSESKKASARILTLVLSLQILLAGCGMMRPAGNSESGNTGGSRFNLTNNTTSTSATIVRTVLRSGDLAAPLSPFEALQIMHNNYRLLPDKRFLSAIPLIHTMIAGSPHKAVDATFDHGLWRISYAGEEVGRVPEFADFGVLLELLSDYSKRLAKRHKFKLASSPSPPAELESKVRALTPRSEIEALYEINRLWEQNGRSLPLLSLAIESMANLSFITDAQMLLRLSDNLTARSLAALALYEGCTGKKRFRERCIFAHELHYHRWARNEARRMTAGEPVALWLTHDKARLEEKVKSSPSPENSLCLLNLCSNLHQHASWRKTAADILTRQNGLALPVLKLFEGVEPVSAVVPYGSYLVGAALHEISSVNQEQNSFNPEQLFRMNEPAAKSTQWLDKDIVERFESSLGRMTAGPSGPFLDDGCAKNFYRSYFYGGLVVLRRNGIQSDLFDGFGTRMMQIDDEMTREIGRAFIAGSQTLEALKGGRHHRRPVHWEDLSKVPLTLVTDCAGFQSPDVRWFFQRADSSPEDLFSLISLVGGSDSGNVGLADRVSSAIARVGWPEQLCQPLMLCAANPRIDVDSRLKIVEFLCNHGELKVPQVEALYRESMQQNPHDWAAVEPLMGIYWHQKRYEEGVKEVSRWLERNKGRSDVDVTTADVSLAYLLMHAGHYQAALDALGDKASTGRFECMRCKAMILEKMGRLSEAVEMAKATVNRAPWFPLQLQLEIYWRNGKYQEAAQLLAQQSRTLGSHLWEGGIGATFAKTFAGNEKGAREAIDVLVKTGIRGWHSLGHLARGIAGEGQYKTACYALMQCTGTRNSERTRLLITYKTMKAAEGEKQALDWLSQQVPPEYRVTLAREAYTLRCFELLWNFLPQNLAVEEPIWLLRAAGYVDSGQRDGKQRKQLLAYYSKPIATSKHRMGQYLMGIKASEKLPNERMIMADLCAASYYIGLKKLNAQPTFEATEWLQLAMETNMRHEFEYRLAAEKNDDVFDQLTEVACGMPFSKPLPHPTYPPNTIPVYFQYDPKGRLP